jgi:transposase
MPLSRRPNTRTRLCALLEARTGAIHFAQRSKTGVAMLAAFFKKWIEQLPPNARTVYLVWDNWPVHYHKTILNVLATDARIQILPLPTYAPWLNPIEKLWRLIKHKTTHAHRLADRFDKLKANIESQIRWCQQNPSYVLQYTGLAKTVT